MTEVGDRVGFGRSDVKQGAIASGATSSTPIDLGRPYAVLVIKVEDCTGFTDAATLSAKVGYEIDGTLADLYEANSPNIIWTRDTPTSGTLAFVLTHAFGARRIQFVASVAATQAITFKVYGYDPVVATP